jgi:hypothetical protein
MSPRRWSVEGWGGARVGAVLARTLVGVWIVSVGAMRGRWGSRFLWRCSSSADLATAAAAPVRYLSSLSLRARYSTFKISFLVFLASWFFFCCHSFNHSSHNNVHLSYIHPHHFLYPHNPSSSNQSIHTRTFYISSIWLRPLTPPHFLFFVINHILSNLM